MKHLIYARVSTDKQDTETQIRIALEKLTETFGDTPYEYVIYDEGDLSSTIHIEKRPKLQEMLSDVRKDDIVVVYMLDRLARDVIEMVSIWRKINKKEAFTYSLTGEHTDELTITIMGAIAQKNRETIQLRTKDKLTTKRKNGERYSIIMPYGYTMHETKLVPIRVGNEIVMKPGILVPIYQEQITLNKMKELFAAGKSYQQIVDTLTDQGYMNRVGKPFQRNSIYRILAQTRRTKLKDQPRAEKGLLVSR